MNLAGTSAIAAGLALVAAAVCLVVFFSNGVDAWGRANDAATALYAVLVIPAVVAVYERYAPGVRWTVGVPTLIGVAGLLIVAVTSGMTAAARLDWLVSAKVGAVGFAGFLGWIGVTSCLILARGGMRAGLAWLGLATLASSVAAGVGAIGFVRAHGSLSGDAQPTPILWVAFGAAFAGVLGWSVWLGIEISVY